ncbi:uncharacterized protein PODANS_1_9350 [Podospora anserina S mat+]|uniref:Podospora anserina S mat+ genomic DNA chromosome 1, supercontig 2 n=6 Tax=Podospora TaxID=5144 RepID=B2AXZ5_PODAN|nr:uncharacterized protein PODANS_1_9350 [Podospora anserina S mat+]KAK4648359.1 hypothetical protein QC761_109350 [Podospora bellae-mahoneyi]KAK4659342.1 hypothetical protein QC762_109350 [Podospora pseudocomata]KAK4673155.1 hypothetical protein QC763_109350 [Podospora pseudopauciseta]KAK4681658.1 hypothetical protein QC764_109350 [Podospora pseudoanserina]VBB72388.1 Putative protein of unknown function [Podospora comata]
MQFKSFFTVLAAGLTMMVAAEEDITTTETSTLTQTQTVTITQCNPTISNCPGHTTTSVETSTSTLTTWTFPLSNSTISVGPTATSKFSIITSRPVVTETSIVEVPEEPTGTTPAPAESSVVEGAAAGLAASHATVLLGVLGAGIALLA